MRTSSGMAPDATARLLAKTSGLDVTESMIAADVASGAPTEPDGSVNLIRYAAWLLRELQRADGPRGG